MSTGSIARTPICRIKDKELSSLYIKRDDLIPYCFGGNKARKAELFFEEIDKGDYDTVVTYGSSHSNHCRIVANMAAARDMNCILIGPSEVSESTYNSTMMGLFGARLITVPVEEVHDCIEKTLQELKDGGHKAYFIPGGGHGNIGTRAYVQCFDEIIEYEKESGIDFDYIFFASGTGTTHAGLVCGQLMHKTDHKIIGISIARKNPRGRDVVLDSIYDYLDEEKIPYNSQEVERRTIFIDDYTGEGYGTDSAVISETIRKSLILYGIPFDSTYTGKAFSGMLDYINKNNLKDSKILFIHTGGTPLFFDDLNKWRRD